VSGGVVFSKLSKLLNQEDALSAPCFKALSQLLWRDEGRRRAISKDALFEVCPKLQLSPLFYQDGQIFIFPRPPKLIRLAEA
jgi:hypothetical protein